jgi:aminopeptidase Y
MMMRTILVFGIVAVFVGFIPAISAMTMNIDQAEILKQSANFEYASAIQIDEVMAHLNALENIAITTSGNRAVRTLGFNRTLDYITNYLTENTNFRVSKTFFDIRSSRLLRNPTLSSTIDGIVKTHTYSTDPATAEFQHVYYSTSANIDHNILLTAIPNLGCSDADWLAASPSPAGLVALVKRGDCSFESKALLANKYNVAALLLYNDGTTSDHIPPMLVNLGENNRVPTLFLSYTLGQSLVDAANDPTHTASVRLDISADAVLDPIGNICADTLTGDPTQTIVIGSHSDSVTAGPGINDNGQYNRFNSYSNVSLFLYR